MMATGYMPVFGNQTVARVGAQARHRVGGTALAAGMACAAALLRLVLLT